MRMRSVLPIAVAAVLSAPASAVALFPHTIAAGESLTSVAAADGLSVAQLAAANGLSSMSQLVAGTTLLIPPQGGAVAGALTTAATVAPSASTTAAPGGDGDGDADDPGVATTGVTPTATATAPASGAYVVQPGDTLSAIAARAGISVDALAAANGLDPNGVLLSGSVLGLSGSSGATATPVSTTVSSVASQPIGPAAEGTPGAPPYPTPETLSASQVASIASSDGVSPSLADAIGWQESGFNNDLVSSAGAVGVMQILPGTWDWIQRTLTAGTALSPSSATDNVRGGVLMLHSLLNSTGGDSALAAAGYYQGLASVQQNGMYSDTQQYVNDVMALRQQFGGP
jgi:LysM repeat protein